MDGTQTMRTCSSCRTDYYSWYNNSNRDIGNSLMSKIEVDEIVKQSGSTLTLGGQEPL